MSRAGSGSDINYNTETQQQGTDDRATSRPFARDWLLALQELGTRERGEL